MTVTHCLDTHVNSKHLPGPGTYKHHEVIGPIKPTRIHSRVKTPQCALILKADDRFKLPSKLRNVIKPLCVESVLLSPGPGKYTTIDCFQDSVASQYKSTGRPIILKD